MKKIRTIITMLIAGAIALTFTSCDMFNSMATSLKKSWEDFWGDPQSEQNELKCGIAHSMKISGDIVDYNNEVLHCDSIDLNPNFGLRGELIAYNGTDEYEYKAQFFYKENPDNLAEGEFYINVTWVWDKKKSKWSTPNHAFYRFDSAKHYYRAKNVDLTTKTTATINASEFITYEEWEAAHDEMVNHMSDKHSGDSTTTDITRNNIFDASEREIRFEYIDTFENALSSPSTTVSYEKVNDVFTYVAKIDGETLELMIFKDGELFFYPYDNTKREFMMGMYSYNQAAYYDSENHLNYKKNKGARKWIRENYPNINALYNELKVKAAEAYDEAKKKAEAEYEEYKKSQD